MRVQKNFQRIGVEEARSLLAKPDILILDVRDSKSYLRDHIEGAKNASIANLAPIIEDTPKCMPVLIYCYHGYASQEYAQVLTDFRFQNVYSLDGGFENWIRHNSADTGQILCT